MIAAFTDLERRLEGWPSGVLSAMLIVAALVLLIIAARGTPLQKAVAVVYVVFP